MLERSDNKSTIRRLKKLLTCSLCNGHLFEPTRVVECMHTFCRTCIVKDAYNQKYYACPICQTSINPLRLDRYLRLDFALQSLISLLNPDLTKAARREKRKFNEIKEASMTVECVQQTTTGEKRRSSAENNEKMNVAVNEERTQILICVQFVILASSDDCSTISQKYFQLSPDIRLRSVVRFVAKRLKVNVNDRLIVWNELNNQPISEKVDVLKDMIQFPQWNRRSSFKIFLRLMKTLPSLTFKRKVEEQATMLQSKCLNPPIQTRLVPTLAINGFSQLRPPLPRLATINPNRISAFKPYRGAKVKKQQTYKESHISSFLPVHTLQQFINQSCCRTPNHLVSHAIANHNTLMRAMDSIRNMDNHHLSQRQFLNRLPPCNRLDIKYVQTKDAMVASKMLAVTIDRKKASDHISY